MNRLVSVRAALDTVNLREGVLEGRTYIVAPVVMMVGNAVIRSMGSRGPEFVPVEELLRAPDGWNGRPVVLNHPTTASGDPSLANVPEILEASRFGYVFGTTVTNGKLYAEMWLDAEKAKDVGHDAVRFVERVLAGEVADVSVGALVAVEERSGEYNGQHYEYVWHDLVPDHLAALPEGTPGACSVQLGCGTPRAAAAATETEEVSIMNLFHQFLSIAVKDKGESDAETRNLLSAALRAVEAGFDSVYEVYPDSQTVIYLSCPEDKYLWKRRKYSVEGGKAVLGDAEEVLPKTTFETVAAEEAAADETGEAKQVTATIEVKVEGIEQLEAAVAAAEAVNKAVPVAACSCTSHVAADAPSQKVEEIMAEATKVQELAGRLIACKGSPFNDGDRAALESMSETRLADLVKEFDKPETPVGAAALTEEQWLAQAPASVRNVFARAQVEEKAQKARLVARLKAAQTHFTEEQLQAKSLEALEELSSILSLDLADADYSGRFVPAPSNASAAPADPQVGFDAAVQKYKAARGIN